MHAPCPGTTRDRVSRCARVARTGPPCRRAPISTALSRLASTSDAGLRVPLMRGSLVMGTTHPSPIFCAANGCQGAGRAGSVPPRRVDCLTASTLLPMDVSWNSPHVPTTRMSSAVKLRRADRSCCLARRVRPLGSVTAGRCGECGNPTERSSAPPVRIPRRSNAPATHPVGRVAGGALGDLRHSSRANVRPARRCSVNEHGGRGARVVARSRLRGPAGVSRPFARRPATRHLDAPRPCDQDALPQ